MTDGKETTKPDAEVKIIQGGEYEQGKLDGVIVLDKHDVTKWMSNLSRSRADNKGHEGEKRYPELEKIYAAFDQMSTRDGLKAVLGRLGVTTDTGDDYRLVFITTATRTSFSKER